MSKPFPGYSLRDLTPKQWREIDRKVFCTQGSAFAFNESPSERIGPNEEYEGEGKDRGMDGRGFNVEP